MVPIGNDIRSNSSISRLVSSARCGVWDGYEAVQLHGRDERAVLALLTQRHCDALMNATDPRFVMPLFRAALQAGTHYLDMAMSLSHPDRDDPYSRTGVKLGDDQFAMAPAWEWAGKLALVGMGVEPGLSDVFARYAADELFSQIDELGVRDGANLEVAGYDFAPTFSIWTTIEECLNPPVVWERDRGWFTTEPFSEPEVFTFPAGIGPVECVNVEHEEVLLMPRWIEAQRVTFKYGLGAEFIDVLRTLHKLGLDATKPVVALELLDSGAWSGTGILGPEALPPRPFLDLLTEYGSPWACEERNARGRLRSGA
jgi:saccharopine dehydrogenase (NAD+, L-lysine-forming)